MRYYTVHSKARAAPVLVREGFSCGALLFGPFWLLAQRAWIPAALVLAIGVVLVSRAPAGLAIWPIWAAIAVLLGLSGRDLQRWSLERRGFVMVHVVAARDFDSALARLLRRRPDFTGRLVPSDLS